MKVKVLIPAMLCAMSICGSIAYADNIAAYTGGSENTATITDTSDYSTVLITKASDNPISKDSVAYIYQADNVFDASMNFILKANPSVGLYNVKLGNEEGTSASTTFYIGVNSNNDSDVPMTRLSSNRSADGKYSTGFFRTVSASEYESYNSLKVGYNNGEQDVYGGFVLKDNGFPQTTGEGDLTLIFELNQIEEDEIDSVSVFLSTDEVGSANAYK